MPDLQLRLFPATQPLVGRLGVEWFRSLPTGPGVYRMQDAGGRILYVGKARNLRRRLNSYRRTQGQARRTVLLIHGVAGIEWELCTSETAALQREAELIRALQPRFNRVGRWTPPPFYVRFVRDGLGGRLSWVGEPAAGDFGPFRPGVRRVVTALAQLLWLVAHPGSSAAEVSHGLACGRSSELVMSQPDDPLWGDWLADYFAVGRLAIVWELDEVLRNRRPAFEQAFLRSRWEEIAQFGRQRNDARSTAG